MDELTNRQGAWQEPQERLFTARAEIDSIQLLTLSQFLAKPHANIFSRVAVRLAESYFGRPRSEKLQFVKIAVTAVCYKIIARFQRFGARLVRRRAPSHTDLVRGEVLRVAVHGTGSVGDFLTHMILIERFYKTYGPMRIDFFCHPIKVNEAKFIFANASFVKDIITVSVLSEVKEHYDLIIHLRYLVRYEIVNHARILAAHPDLFNVIQTADQRFAPYEYIFDRHPFLDGLFARQVVSEFGMNLAEVTGYLGNIAIERDARAVLAPDMASCRILSKCGLEGRRYVTIHHGFDTGYPLPGTVTKCWPIEHWKKFVSLFKARYPDLLLVQLGAEKSCHVDGVDIDLVGKTTLAEAAWILKYALFHVDGESGLVRMAHALHAQSVVLFGPTSPGFFSFTDNVNVVAQTCHDCWWSKRAWLAKCPRGLPEPECMTSIDPGSVMTAVEELIANFHPAKLELVAASLYEPEHEDYSLSPDLNAERRATPKFAGLPAQKCSAAREAWQSHFVCSWLEKSGAAKLDIVNVFGGKNALALHLAGQGHQTSVVYDNSDTDGLPAQRACDGRTIEILYGSVANIAAESETFDLALFLPADGRLEGKEYALRDSLRIVKQGGHLVICLDVPVAAVDGDDHRYAKMGDCDVLERLLEDVGIAGPSIATLRGWTGKAVPVVDRLIGSTFAALVIRKGA
jgi:ADP-heptose:LPS heptosyltransferase